MKKPLKTAAQIAAEAPAPESADDAPEPPRGLVCPRCGCADLRLPDGRAPWMVQKTEKILGGVRRRRVCRHCGKVIYTRERPE